MRSPERYRSFPFFFFRLLPVVLGSLLPGAAAGSLPGAQEVGRRVSVPAKRTGDTIRVATFNLENLFDLHDDPYRPDEGTPPKNFWEMRDLGRVLDLLDPDILGLQEVENLGILRSLNRRLKKPFPIVEALPTNDPRGIRCALMSRFPLESASSHRFQVLEGGRRFARDLPVFTLALGRGSKLRVLVLHLKSHRSTKGDPESRGWRKAEAARVREILDRLPAEEPLILMGDLNDPPDAKALAPLFEVLTDAALRVPEEERYSYVFRGRRQRIDHVLTRGMPAALRAGFVHDPMRASDHHPLWADFPWKDPRRLPAPEGRKAVPPFRPRIRASDAAAARRLLCREVEVEGVLREVRPTRRGGHLQLLFEGAGAGGITGFIPAFALERFGDPARWRGRKVLLRGPLFLYRGKPEIRLTRKEQFQPIR